MQKKQERQLGVHVSVAGGMHTAFARAEKLAINAMQVFLKNNNRWSAPGYTIEDVEKFIEMKDSFGQISIFAHSGYLLNLAGNGPNLEKSLHALEDEMSRASLLNIDAIVIHPGSHVGQGLDAGISNIVDSIGHVMNRVQNVRLLLETTAGQGTSIGHRFEQLAAIIEQSSHKSRLGVCLDTCHIFAAGYDISSEQGTDCVLNDFNDIIGLDRLKLVHLNDSKKNCGSRVDRHEHIGDGMIGLEGFHYFLNHPNIKHVPLVLETPKSKDDEFKDDLMNLKRVRELL